VKRTTPKNHAKDPVKGKFDFEVEKRVNDLKTRRGLEQEAYDKYKPKLNKQRPIDPKNPKKPDYMKAAQDFNANKAGGASGGNSSKPKPAGTGGGLGGSGGGGFWSGLGKLTGWW
jgi:hypothetical protein